MSPGLFLAPAARAGDARDFDGPIDEAGVANAAGLFENRPIGDRIYVGPLGVMPRQGL